MALGIVSDEIFESQVPSKEPDSVEIVSIKGPGRRPGDKEVPGSIRKIIGDTAIESGNSEAREMAQFFGLNPQAVSTYKNGATSLATYNKPDRELKNHLNRTKERITRKAAKGIRRAFDNLTDEKLADATAPELASVIRSFSSVIKDMSVSDEVEADKSNVQFVFFTPPLKQEDSFEVIEASV